MKKTLIAIAAAATLALATVAAPQQAEARGGRIAAGIIGGLAAGALIGAYAANGPYYYGPRPYYYAPGPVYYGGTAIGAMNGSGTGIAGAGTACAFATDGNQRSLD